MKKLLFAAASIAVIASAAPAFAAPVGAPYGPGNFGAAAQPKAAGGGAPTSIGTNKILDAEQIPGQVKEMLSDVGGTINAKCAFSVASPANYRLNLYDKGAGAGTDAWTTTISLPLQCNFGSSYSIQVTASNGHLKNTDDTRTTGRDSDVNYNAAFSLVNSSTAHAWADKSLPKTALTYNSGAVTVDAASGRSQVTLKGVINFTENTNSKVSEGGIAWRAGKYIETFTSVITPTVAGTTFSLS